jgi:hypothetical protein
MNMQETITKLKEMIFVKKGTGQECQKEEELLKSLEDQEAEALRLADENLKALNAKKAELDASWDKVGEIKKKFSKVVTQYQGLLLDLFREERNREALFEHLRALRIAGGMELGSFTPPGRSIFIGSTRTQWVEDEIFPLSEDFRMRLIADNREYYAERRKTKKQRVRPPVADGVKFIPEQVQHMIQAGLDVPAWMRERLHKWEVARKKEIKENPVESFDVRGSLDFMI